MSLHLPDAAPTPMSPGLRDFTRLLESRLGAEYLCWQGVPGGSEARPANFLLLHPRRGLLLLELRDWGPARFQASLPGLEADATSPLEEIRDRAQALIRELEQDPHLTFSRGRMAGQLRFPWSWGLVLGQIRRDPFMAFGLGDAMDARRVLCQDEIQPEISGEDLARRLWDMFPLPPFGQLSPMQIQRIRWRLFPDLRLSPPGEDPPRVLDADQEAVIRNLEGHRVILGPAGTGKSTVLLQMAARLARRQARPVLLLCLNKALARRLEHEMHALGGADRVHIGTFPAWCHRLLTQNHLGLPGGDPAQAGYADALAERVAQGLDRQRIASAQYGALLIDEGHGFSSGWLALAQRFLDPLSDVLALTADTDQLPAGVDSFLAGLQAAGIRCRGRVSRLAANHRNSGEILAFAAAWLEGQGEPSTPPAGRTGKPPEQALRNSYKEEAAWLAEHLLTAHLKGTPWRHMAVLYGDWENQGKVLNNVFRQAGIPMTWQDGIRFGDRQDTLKLLSLNGAQGLEFPLVGLPGMTAPEDPAAAGLLRMALLRARDTLLISGPPQPK